MISYLDKLNLRPAEKRLVVAVVFALFIVLNLIFVVPQFGEWGRIENRAAYSLQQIAKYRAEVDQETKYRRELARLKQIGLTVPSEDQGLLLNTRIDELANQAGVILPNYSLGTTLGSKTNAFFEERSATLSISATEKQLIDFLDLLGSSDSLIRVRSMNVNPELPARMRLGASLTVVASFQKKPPTKPPVGTSVPKATVTNSVARPAANPFKAGSTNARGPNSKP